MGFLQTLLQNNSPKLLHVESILMLVKSQNLRHVMSLYSIDPIAITCRCWVAAYMCVKSHFRTCDVCAEVRAERVLNCACESACVCAYL